MTLINITASVCVLMSLFQLYSSVQTVDAYILRTTHLGFALIIIFLAWGFSKKKQGDNNKIHIIDIVLIAGSIFTIIYPIIHFDRLVNRWPYVSPLTLGDMVFGLVVIFLVIEASRRVVGWILPIIGISSIAYIYFGNLLPGIFGHKGFSLVMIIDHLTQYTEGLFGIPLAVSATFAFLFILFGSILYECGAAQYFFKFASAICGKQKGGIGKVAVIASALMGTVTGSSPGNVFATGTITIPMMKKTGFTSTFAGAVEAAASTGGQIMPPVMGSAAFLMAEFLGIPYKDIIIVAIIPAILYFLSLLVSLHLYSLKHDLQGLKELPPFKTVIKESYFFIPIAALIISLILGYSATRSCLVSIVVILSIALITKNLKETIKIMLRAMNRGAKNSVVLAVCCGVAGIFMGTLTITGLAFRLTTLFFSIAGGIEWLMVTFVMIAVIIMGMGMPTPAAYAFGAALAAPVLVELGFNKIASHFFILYFACFSSLTPPVALASFAAATIAGSDFVKTGYTALLLGIVGLLIPFQFLYSPQLILLEISSVSEVIRIILGALVGAVSLSFASQGWMFSKLSIIERLLTFIAAITLINTRILTDIMGVFILLVVVTYQLKKVHFSPLLNCKNSIENKLKLKRINK